MQFAVACRYLPPDTVEPIDREYDELIAMLVEMIRNPGQWLI
jgi:hypothetical protein